MTSSSVLLYFIHDRTTKPRVIATRLAHSSLQMTMRRSCGRSTSEIRRLSRAQLWCYRKDFDGGHRGNNQVAQSMSELDHSRQNWAALVMSELPAVATVGSDIPVRRFRANCRPSSRSFKIDLPVKCGRRRGIWASGCRGLASLAKARPARWKWLALKTPENRMSFTRRPFRARKFRAVGSSCSPMTFFSCLGNASPGYPSIAASLPVRCMRALWLAPRMATNVEIACGNWCTMRNEAFTICRSLDHLRHRLKQFASV